MSAMFREIQVRVTTTGSAGSATGTGDSEPITGEVVSVGLNYHVDAPNTTTVDLDELGGNSRKILDKAASKTDVIHHPRQLMQDTTGADQAGVYERIALVGRKIRISVAACDPLTNALVATIVVRER